MRARWPLLDEASDAAAGAGAGGGLDDLAAAARAADAGQPLPGAEAPQLAPPPPASDGRLDREAATALSRVGLDWVAAALTQQYPVLVPLYSEETRARGAVLAGAVLAKYPVLAWVGRWREEFELGAFVAGVAWKSYQLVKNPPPASPDDRPAAAAAGR